MTDTKRIILIKRMMVFAAMLFLFNYMDFGGMKKYAIAIILSVIFGFMGRKNAWEADTFLVIALPAGIYVLLGSLSGMLHGTYQIVTVKLILYSILPLLLAFACYVFSGKDMHWNVDAQFLSSCIIYGIPNYVFFSYGDMWESTFAFAFGENSLVTTESTGR